MFLRITEFLTAADAAGVAASLSDQAAAWVDGRATAGHQGAQVKQNQQVDEASPLARELGGLVIARLERHPVFIIAVLPHKVYPPVFNRFATGMQFGTHVHGSIRTIAATGEKLRTDLSTTLFITPPEAYEGSELLIETEAETRSAKLGAGDLLVYSAAWPHRVTTVTRGTRLAAVFWIQSMCATIRTGNDCSVLSAPVKNVLSVSQIEMSYSELSTE